jgi:hypothetical protein
VVLEELIAEVLVGIVEFLVGFLGRWAGAVGNDFLDDFGGSIGG